MNDSEQIRDQDRSLRRHPAADASPAVGDRGPAAPRGLPAVRVSGALWGLAGLDLALAALAFAAPGLWFDLMHGAPYVDPQGLLPRTGASWLMFALLEAVAAVRWRQEPTWLAAIAAVRASDTATDWTYLVSSGQDTRLGTVLLAGASPANLVLALLFWRWWRACSVRRG